MGEGNSSILPIKDLVFTVGIVKPTRGVVIVEIRQYDEQPLVNKCVPKATTIVPVVGHFD